MSRFYRRNVREQKNSSAATALATSTAIGQALGWAPSIAQAIEWPSRRTVLAADLMQDDQPRSDFRLIITASMIDAKNWRLSKKYVNNDLTNDELDILYIVHDLFCKWKNTNLAQYTLHAYLEDLITYGTAVGDNVKTDILTNLADAIDASINNSIFNPARIPVLLDAGFALDIWANEFQKIKALVDAGASSRTDYVRPAAGNLINQIQVGTAGGWDSNLACWGQLSCWKFATKSQGPTLIMFANCVASFLNCLTKDSRPSQQWLQKGNDRLAEKMNLPAGTLTSNPDLSFALYSSMNVEKIPVNTLKDALVSICQFASACEYDPVIWRVNQAAYTGMTPVVTMVENLATYSEMPWGLLFTDVIDELITFLKACMYGYLFPYHGLKEVKFKATTFPNIAQASIRIARDVRNLNTYRSYKGIFATSTAQKVDKIVTTYETFFQALTSGNAIADYLGDIFGDRPTITVRNGRLFITTTPAGVAAQMPAAWPAELRNVFQHYDQNAGTMDADIKSLMVAIKAHHRRTTQTDAIKVLYDCIPALNGEFLVSPLTEGIDVANTTRPVPGQGSALESLATLTDATNMAWT